MLSNFIPHEIIICDDKDTLWFNRDEASKWYGETSVATNTRLEPVGREASQKCW